MTNIFIQSFISFLGLPLLPSGLRSIKEKRILRPTRTLWSVPGYKSTSVFRYLEKKNNNLLGLQGAPNSRLKQLTIRAVVSQGSQGFS